MQAARRSSSSSDSSSEELLSSSELESREEEDEERWIFGREVEEVVVREKRLGRVAGFLGSGAGFDSTFFFATILGSGAFLGVGAALAVGGLFERDFFSLGFEDFSAFSLEDLTDFDTTEADFADLDVAVFDGVGGVTFAGGGAVLALNCSNGLGHEPIGFGVSSAGGGSALFLDLGSVLEGLAGAFGCVFGSGVDLAVAVAVALIGAPLLPVATGGGGGVSGTAASPNSCRARSFTLGNMVYAWPGCPDSIKVCAH